MPRKPRPQRKPVTLRLHDFLPHEQLRFLVAWEPPTTVFESERSRWQTWEAFMRDWQAVRDEYLMGDSWETLRGNPPYAELLLRTFGPKGPRADMSYEQILEVLHG